MTRQDIVFKIKRFVKRYSMCLGKNKFSKMCNMGWGKIERIMRSANRSSKYDTDDLIDIFEIMQYEFNKNLELEEVPVKLKTIRW